MLTSVVGQRQRAFHQGQEDKEQGRGQAKEADLFQLMCRCRWRWSGLENRLSYSDGRELRKLVDHEHP